MLVGQFYPARVVLRLEFLEPYEDHRPQRSGQPRTRQVQGLQQAAIALREPRKTAS